MPDTSQVDENTIRAKLVATNKYSNDEIDGLVSRLKTPGYIDKLQPYLGAKVNVPTRQKPLPAATTDLGMPDTGVVGDAMKSIWNGFGPEMAKGVTLIPKLVGDATGNKSDWLDGVTKSATDAIDKYATFEIPKEYQGSLLSNPRSFINGLGQGTGMILNAIALAYATGGIGDVAEGVGLVGEGTGNLAKATEAFNIAKKTGDLAKISKASETLNAAQKVHSTIANLTGAASFTTQMINPIYEKGKAAGLSDTDNARMTLMLAPVVGAAGTMLPGTFKTAADGLFGKEVLEATTQGLEKDLSALAGEDATSDTFKEVAKRATERMNGNLKEALTKYGKAGAEGAGNMYFINALQNAGEQLYDNMYADPNAKVGEGKFGTNVLGKKEFVENMQSAMLGGILGMGAATIHQHPIFDQTMYGYLDGATQKGEAEGKKAVDKLNKITDDLVTNGKLTADQAKGIKDRVGKIKATADTFAKLKGLGTPIDADTRYEAYNLQNNVKQDIIDNGIKPYEAAQAEHDKMQLALDTEKKGVELDPGANPAALGKLKQIMEDSTPEYESAKEKVKTIDTYLDTLGRTGKRGDITGQLRAIDEKYHPELKKPETEANVEPEPTLPDTEVKGSKTKEHFDSLTPEQVTEQHGIVSKEVESLQDKIKGYEAEKKEDTTGESHPEIDQDIATAQKQLTAKQADLEYLGNLASKTKGKDVEPEPTEDDITINEVLNKPVTYKGQKANLYLDGKTLVAGIKGSNREYEIGNIDEIGKRPIKDYGIEHQESVVASNEKGNVVVRGKEYVNKYSDPTAAINYDEKGNVVSVNLETPEGQKRAFKGDVAEDIAYQITLQDIEKRNETGQLEQFINTNENARKAVNDTRLENVAEVEATENNAGIQRKKAARKVRQENRIKKQNKTSENEKSETNSGLVQGNSETGEKRNEESANDGTKRNEPVQTGTGNDRGQNGGERNAQGIIPEEAKPELREKLKAVVKDDYEGLLEKMITNGAIKEVPCR